MSLSEKFTKAGVFIGERIALQVLEFLIRMVRETIRARAVVRRLEQVQRRVKRSVYEAKTRQEKIDAARENARASNNS